jgi:hypothetical protein
VLRVFRSTQFLGIRCAPQPGGASKYDSRPRTRSAGAELVHAISGSHPADPLSLGRSCRGGFAAVLAAERCIVGDLRQIRELPWKGDIRMRWS